MNKSSITLIGGLVILLTVSTVYGITDLASNDHVAVDSQKRMYLDGGSNTYVQEFSSDKFGFVAGGTQHVLIDGVNDNVNIDDAYVSVSPGERIYLDGGSNTYIHESSADKFEIVVGGNTMFTSTSGDICLGSGCP